MVSKTEQAPPFPVFGDQCSIPPIPSECVWSPPMPRPESPTWLFYQSQGHVSETAGKVVELEMNNYET